MLRCKARFLRRDNLQGLLLCFCHAQFSIAGYLTCAGMLLKYVLMRFATGTKELVVARHNIAFSSLDLTPPATDRELGNGS